MTVLKADPKLRRKLYIVYALIVASGFVILKWGWPAFESLLKQKKTEEALEILLMTLAILFLSALPLGIYVFRYSRRILAAGQFPLPGSKVIHDTKILMGSDVHRRAYFLMIGGLFIAAASLFGGIYLPYKMYKSFHYKMNQESSESLTRDAAQGRRAP